MKLNNQHSRFYQTGFSLVEIMVGLVIGLLATLVVLQVFSVFEGQKRTTTGTADAQTSGNVALYTIRRDLEMAGYGLLPVTDSPLECTAPVFDPATGVTTLSPVTIADGGLGAGASDTITIRYATSDTGGSFTKADITGTVATVEDNQSCNVGDIAIVIRNVNSCNLYKVAGLSTTRQVTLTNAVTASGANIACLGTWQEIQYGINPNYNPAVPANSQAYLQRNDTPTVPANAIPTEVNIVNLQAQYGISDTANSNKITRWVNAKDLADWDINTDGAKVIDLVSGANINWGASLTDDHRNLIKAVRIAVVARNGLLEKTNVSDPCSSLTGNSPTGLCTWDGSSAGTVITSPAPNIDLSNDPDWRRYRYRVYETIIPLRNVIWSKSTL